MAARDRIVDRGGISVLLPANPNGAPRRAEPSRGRNTGSLPRPANGDGPRRPRPVPKLRPRWHRVRLRHRRLAQRLRAALATPAGIGYALVSVLLGGLLLFVPSLQPWQERAGWVVGWGVLAYLATALVVAWPRYPPPHPPSPAPSPETQPLPPDPEPPLPLPPAPPPETYPDGLTHRQVEVLCLVAAGKTTKEISALLFLAVSTVDRHIADIYRKTNSRNRAEATAYAIRHHLCGSG